MAKDEHYGSHLAFLQAFTNCVPFDCSWHKRNHISSDTGWGVRDERLAMVALYDVCLRCTLVDEVQKKLADFKKLSVTKGWKLAYNRLTSRPLEYVFPAMSGAPTGSRSTVRNAPPVGSLWGGITSNTAECFNKMLLNQRAIACPAMAQVSCPPCHPPCPCNPRFNSLPRA